jgi:hypothetical protein
MIPANEAAYLLRVNLPSPVVEVIRPKAVLLTPVQRGLAWLTDVLSELAFS